MRGTYSCILGKERLQEQTLVEPFMVTQSGHCVTLLDCANFRCKLCDMGQHQASDSGFGLEHLFPRIYPSFRRYRTVQTRETHSMHF